MAYKITSGPASYPVTLAEAKLWLRVDGSDHDALITDLIKAATEQVEYEAGVRWITRTVEQYCDSWPTSVIELSVNPVTAVTSVEYIPEGGSAYSTYSSTKYDVDLVSIPARIVKKIDETFTSEAQVPNAIKITYQAGAATAPETAKTSIKLILSSLYEMPEDVVMLRTGQFNASAVLNRKLRYGGTWV